MRALRAWLLRLVGSVATTRREQDFADELESHIQLHVDDNLRAGLSPTEARRQALLQLGGIEATKEHHRDRRGLPWLSVLSQDLVYAWRQSRKRPGFAVAAVLSIALAIGANTAVFSVLHTSLQGPPFEGAERIVVIRATPPQGAEPGLVLSVPEYLALRDGSRVFEHVGAMLGWSYNLGPDRDGVAAERLLGWRYTDTVFPVMGVRPQLGRGFNAAENRLDAPPGSAMISHGLWQRQFGGDPAIVGRVIRIDELPTTIVGVMPEGFRLFGGSAAVDIWTPLPFLTTQIESAARGPGTRFVMVVARMKPGVSLEQAQADLQRIAGELAATYPNSNNGWGFSAQPLDDAIFGQARPLLLILQMTVVFVLLIACTNVAGLLLVRAASRQREVATRCALGAARARIVHQFLTESAVLALAGGVVGLGLAWTVVRLVNRFPLQFLANFPSVAIDWQVLAFTFTVALGAGLAFGMLPAWHSVRGDMLQMIRQAGRGGGDRSRRVQRVLVAAQIAVTLVLLIGAGLLIKSFMRLQGADLGVNPDRVLTFDTRLPSDRYQKPAGIYAGLRMLASSPVPARIFDQIHQRLLEIPGVEAAAGTSWPLLSGATTRVPFTIEGREGVEPPGDIGGGGETAVYYMATPGVFQTMRIPIRRGRDFSTADTAATPWVAVINDAMARQYWPDEDPIGKRVTARLTMDEQPREIVGIVGDVALTRTERAATPTLWVLRVQQPPHYLSTYGQRTQMTYAVRLRGSVETAVPAIRRAVAAADPTVPIANLELLDDVLSRQIETPRFYMLFVGGFGAIALLLAMLGLYGLVSYVVAERSREIALRIALGAGVGRVVRLVLREGTVLVVIGVSAGLLGASVAMGYVEAMLWEVETTDPTTFTGVTALLALVALLANLVPTRRVLRLDPKVVLREE